MEWIEDQVRHWLGASFEAGLLDDWTALRMQLESSAFGRAIDQQLGPRDVTSEAIGQKYGSFGSYRLDTHVGVMQEMERLGGAEYLSKDIIVPVLMVDIIGPDLPVIGYNRSVVHENVCSSLWPLQYHLNTAVDGLADSQSFLEKHSKLIFRGALSGNLETLRDRRFEKFSRLQILEIIRANFGIADLAITVVPDENKEIVKALGLTTSVNRFLGEAMSFEKLLSHRFVLCLEGADISSGFGGVLASNCVPLVPYPYNFEVWYFNGLLPWKHFVPIRRDGSNICKVMKRCLSQPDEMRMISQNGREHMKRMLDNDYLEAIKRKFLQGWNMPKRLVI